MFPQRTLPKSARFFSNKKVHGKIEHRVLDFSKHGPKSARFFQRIEETVLEFFQENWGKSAGLICFLKHPPRSARFFQAKLEQTVLDSSKKIAKKVLDFPKNRPKSARFSQTIEKKVLDFSKKSTKQCSIFLRRSRNSAKSARFFQKKKNRGKVLDFQKNRTKSAIL